MSSDARQEDLENDPRLGATRKARRTQLKGLRKIARRLDLVGIAVGFWVFLLPYPHDVCVIVAITVAIFAFGASIFSHGVLSIESLRSDPRPAIDGLYFGPALGLAMRAMLDINLLDLQAALLLAFALAAVMVGLLFVFDRKFSKKRSSAIAILLVTFGFAYGFVCETNAMLDTTRPKVFPAVIADKQVHSPRKGVATFKLVLGSWGNQAAGEILYVSPAYYRAVGIGETICVELRGGAWGIRYVDAGFCPSQPQASRY